MDIELQLYVAMLEYVIYDTVCRYRSKGFLTLEEKTHVLDFASAICRSFSKTLERINI